jgi:hypothetical protein
MKSYKPLAPLNPEGLDDIAKAILEDKTPESTPLIMPSDMNKADFIKIPETKTVISKKELYKGDNLDWQGSHFKLAENGLYMPIPDKFMKYFLSVQRATQGDITLYDANNNPIPRDEVEELWNYYSSTERGDKGVCWTWLDAKFEQTDKGFYLLANHRVIAKNGEKILQGDKQPLLESRLNEDCYTNLEFNAQGLPTKKSTKTDYVQGDNIRYWHPRNGKVARFGAGSDWAILCCDRDPGNSSSWLGVFACADFEE